MKNDLRTIDIKELAILVSSEMEKNNIGVVLVGGACVSIYTSNKYLSNDLDFITFSELDEVGKVLNTLGFYKETSRHFENINCPFFIEFPPGPVALGKEVPITRFSEKKSLKLLTPTDCVKDRLAAYYHWDDQQSLKQALLVAEAQKVDLKEIERWSVNEEKKDKYDRFVSLINKKKKDSTGR